MSAGRSVFADCAPSRAPRALLGNLKDALLGAVDELARRQSLVAEHRGGDLGACADELPQQRALAHDVGVGAHVGSRGRIARQGAEVGKAAHLLQKPGAL